MDLKSTLAEAVRCTDISIGWPQHVAVAAVAHLQAFDASTDEGSFEARVAAAVDIAVATYKTKADFQIDQLTRENVHLNETIGAVKADGEAATVAAVAELTATLATVQGERDKAYAILEAAMPAPVPGDDPNAPKPPLVPPSDLAELADATAG